MTEQEKKMILQYEDEENFREMLRYANEPLSMFETKRENGFTYWESSNNGNSYIIFKSKKPFSLSFEINQIPKTKIDVFISKVKVFAMTREEFVKYIYED